ncbi:hypothetical protein [Micromonospora sp. NPDC005172]|uniref:hypothetical protein n=1 Tax=Micromonospora sp. NPDC005172 TaxID=3156867 RepID=UPI0033BCD27F
MKKPVLIASASFDEHAYGPVSKLLERQGYPVVVYKTDRLLSGEDKLQVNLSGETPSITYNGVSIASEDLSAAWYRKVGSFSLADADSQLAKQLYMNNEVRALHDTIWPSLYPEGIWLSAPGNIAHADRKLQQLLIARQVGFSVPQTMVGSDWKSLISTLLPSQQSLMIVKMMRGVISDENQIKAMPTTILNRQKATELAAYTSPFPGLYQPYIPKAREWRVTVVGQQVFPAAIYTESSAKDDWRIHQESLAVQFKSEELPDGVGELCIQYLQEMGIGFGAFDLIERPDGEVVFLECNPNGQYGWLEEDLALPISEAIAGELGRIAEAA